MCGISGLIAKTNIGEGRFNDFIKSSDLMNHRGPDHRGVFRNKNVLLVHYRLSILDLDSRSNQPFSSKNEEYQTVYNGEIYNYKELQSKYKINPSTTSDTEIMLESFAQAGSEATKDWNGIFAIAIFNQKDENLYLIRDRYGVKPLYIYESDEVILFASEAKVIMDWLPKFTINKKVLTQFLWYGNATGSAGFINGLSKVEPGTILKINTKDQFSKEEKKYWTFREIKESKISQDNAISKTKQLLENAVKRQLVADVPVGVLLSGGIDSSSIVAFASKHYHRKIDTYSVEYDYNIGGKSELEKARLISNKFGTNHHELKISSDNIPKYFSELVFQYDEPFADAASIPLFQLAKECSKDKRVILQGDGGDEFFAGYRRYNVMDSFLFWKFSSYFYPIIPERRWKERFKRLNFVLNQSSRGKLLAYYLTEETPYKSPYQIINNEYRNALQSENWEDDYIQTARQFENLDRVQQLLYTDTSILLPNRYLEKVDKATMLCSVEARVPFLDNELSEFALSLPSKMKVQKGQKKFILKKAMEGLVPNEILYGPKRGFDVPIRTWLREDLYDFAKESFQNHDLGLLDKTNLLKLLDIHKSKKADYSALLWKSLVLSHWLELYKGKVSI